MKNYNIVILACIISFLFGGLAVGYFPIANHESNEKWVKKVRYEMVPMDEFYRRVMGFDSITITSNYEGTKLNVNFCYPNQWEFDKFHRFITFNGRIVEIKTGNIDDSAWQPYDDNP